MDTCDECGPAVEAKMRIVLPPTVTLPEGGTLTYCDHHTNRYSAKLQGMGAFSYRIDEEACAPQPA